MLDRPSRSKTKVGDWVLPPFSRGRSFGWGATTCSLVQACLIPIGIGLGSKRVSCTQSSYQLHLRQPRKSKWPPRLAICC